MLGPFSITIYKYKEKKKSRNHKDTHINKIKGVKLKVHKSYAQWNSKTKRIPELKHKK